MLMPGGGGVLSNIEADRDEGQEHSEEHQYMGGVALGMKEGGEPQVCVATQISTCVYLEL